MASQTKSQTRRSTTTTRTEFATSTPRARTPSSPSSALSPAKITRQEEKDSLIGLNDRLATYIDRVRQLEFDNGRLQTQISTFEETQTREITNIKELYEKELTDARKLLDETAGDKAKLQIECGKYKTELDDLRPRVFRLEKDLTAANKRVAVLESQLAEKDGRITALATEKRSLENELNEIRRDLNNKDKQLKVAKKQVEEETLLRVDLENRIQSLKEELAFNKELYQKEVKEIRSKMIKEIINIEREGFNESSNLFESLQEFRTQFTDETTSMRQETETLFHTKLADLKNLAERHRNAAVSSQDEIRKLRTSVDSLTSEVTTLRAQNDALIARIKDLEQQLQREEDAHREALDLRDTELQQLRDAIAEQLRDYDDLLNIKLTLDQEITVYRKLLEGEETRLKIDTPPRKRKRPSHRVEDESSVVLSNTSSGVIAIIESDAEGNFVKLHNASDTDQAMGGWQLKQSVSGGDEVAYKFTPKYVLKAGKEVTVWASGSSNKVHSPPSDIVAKGTSTWGSGDSTETNLVDATGELMATRTVSKERSSHEIKEREERDRCSLM